MRAPAFRAAFAVHFDPGQVRAQGAHHPLAVEGVVVDDEDSGHGAVQCGWESREPKGKRFP